jgi:tubulin polyglutamylase TTLL11
MDNKIEFHNIMKQFDFTPTGYSVKNKTDITRIEGKYVKDRLWFLKYPSNNRGNGIFIDTLENHKKRIRGYNQYLLQLKIEPMLYDGRKADTRFRMLLFNTDKTNDMYLHKIGLLRLAQFKYNATSKSKQVQLTNLSINEQKQQDKQNRQTRQNRINRMNRANKVPFDQAVAQQVAQQVAQKDDQSTKKPEQPSLQLIDKGSFKEYDKYLGEITKIATDIKNAYKSKLKYGSYNYFIGLDIMVDSKGKFWLLEINPNPAFVTTGEFYEKCNKIQLRDTVKLYHNRYFGGKEEHGWIKL